MCICSTVLHYVLTDKWRRLTRYTRLYDSAPPYESGYTWISIVQLGRDLDPPPGCCYLFSRSFQIGYMCPCFVARS